MISSPNTCKCGNMQWIGANSYLESILRRPLLAVQLLSHCASLAAAVAAQSCINSSRLDASPKFLSAPTPTPTPTPALADEHSDTEKDLW